MNSIEFANANDLEAKSLNELYADALQTITSYEKMTLFRPQHTTHDHRRL